MKIFTIIGTRPEALKMIPVIRCINSSVTDLSCKVVLTGQHREMVDELMQRFDVHDDYDLDVMQSNQTPSMVVATIVNRLEPLLKKEQPDWILVQGDTASALAAAICGCYNKVRVGHVEAGLRSGDKARPFPEELNRRLIACTADVHFAPTPDAVNNLRKENIDISSIRLTGNTIVDMLETSLDKFHLKQAGAGFNNVADDVFRILVTAHRRENFTEGIANICQAIRKLCFRYRDKIKFIWPVHPNPHVTDTVYQQLSGLSNVELLSPLNYMQMLAHMLDSYLIMTDSGGIQEEAPALGKPVLVLRQITERPEGIRAGVARLTGVQTEQIYRDVVELIEDHKVYKRMARKVYPYGNAGAALKIVETLESLSYNATHNYLELESI